MLASFAYAQKNPIHIGHSVVYTLENETYEDINSDIKSAINDKGIVISYTSHAKKMFDRTAKSSGFKQGIYKHAQIHLFCQSSTSHKMVRKNPHIIAACPYSIAVYELRDKKNTIYVSYREYPKEKSYKNVNKLQKEIIEEALDL